MKELRIENVSAFEVLDSRGNPTLASEIRLSDKSSSVSYIPSGASTGKHEAIEMRDFDKDRYFGKGVLKAVNLVNTQINDLLKGQNPLDQRNIDSILCQADGTENKSKLGANSILSVSLANLKVSAKSQRLPLYEYLNLKSKEFFSEYIKPQLPRPMMNILNGGIHADNSLDFQEFMVQPTNFETFHRAFRCGVEIYHQLKYILRKKKLNTSLGDEGGFSPEVGSTEEAIDLIIQAIEAASYKPGKDVFICLDCASSELYGQGRYSLEGEGKSYSSNEMVNYMKDLSSKYPINSIEDPLDEDDWKGWELLTSSLGSRIQLVGDDLFVTNSHRIQKGVDRKVANSVLIKINQIGTISEALEAVEITRRNGYLPIISHRSGETEDTSIADICVGAGIDQIKTGAPARTDRTAKYNRMLILEKKFKLQFHGSNKT